MITSRINGKRVFGAGMILTILTAAVIWQFSAQEGQAQSTGGFASAIFTVSLDTASVNTLTSAVASPTQVSVVGSISFADGDATDNDVVRIWGTKQTVGGKTIATVNMNFELPSFNGMITAQGTLTDVVNDAIHGNVTLVPGGTPIFNGDDVIAITGGTGTFRGANGEARIHVNSDGTFTVRLLEAKRR